MTALMAAKRNRLIVDVDPEVRIAVKIAALKAGVSSSDLVESILREHLAVEIREAKKYPSSKKEEGEE